MTADEKMPLYTNRQGSTGWLVFNRPEKKNAVTFSMWREIPRLVEDMDKDPAIRVIALRGSGDEAFSAGADIGEFDEVRSGADAGRNYDAANDAAFQALANVKKPTIAVIDGYCLGGGLALALNCDLRIASTHSTFAIPAARLGVGYAPDWVHQLVSIVGPAHAKAIFFTGNRFSATKALHFGLINQCADGDDLEKQVNDLISQITVNAPLSIRAIKAAIDSYAFYDHDKSYLRQLADQCYDSADFAEGRRAFMEKRKPDFKGE